MTPNRIVALALLFAACAAPAAAQTTPPDARGFVAVNVGYQVTTHDFSDQATFDLYAEQARFDSDYTVDGGPAVDISGGALVWRRLGIGAGVTRFSRSTPVAVTGEVPHPFFFNRPRSVSGEVSGAEREELAVHVQARGVFPIGARMQVSVFGGPSFFQVKQGIVTEFDFAESYPYDEATFAGGTVTRSEESAVGFNAGADVAVFFTRHVGAGAGLQYAGATVDLASADGGTQAVDAGGLQALFGLRLRF